MRVGVFGARGRMGQEVCRTVDEAPGLTLSAQVDLGDDLGPMNNVEAVVDFTHPDAVMGHIEWCVTHGVHMVVGTTGFTPERLDQVRAFLAKSPSVGVVIAPNFAIGAVLMMRFSQIAAPYFESVEIMEAHHPQKVDAPSGTAAMTARLVAAARQQAGCPPVPDATSTQLDGARGADVDGVHVHSLRLAGLIAHQEVLLTSTGETLSIVNDSRSRSSYMPGVLAAIPYACAHPGLTYGLEPVLGV